MVCGVAQLIGVVVAAVLTVGVFGLASDVQASPKTQTIIAY